MIPRRIFAICACVLLAYAIAGVFPRRAAAQAIQKSLYVSVVNDAGVPVPDLGTTDFIVKEDNTAREVLSVRPADEPMTIALLVDTSQMARNDIAHMRTALPPFVTMLTNPSERGEKSQIALSHRKLASKADADRMRAFWSERLEALASLMTS